MEVDQGSTCLSQFAANARTPTRNDRSAGKRSWRCHRLGHPYLHTQNRKIVSETAQARIRRTLGWLFYFVPERNASARISRYTNYIALSSSGARKEPVAACPEPGASQAQHRSSLKLILTQGTKVNMGRHLNSKLFESNKVRKREECFKRPHVSAVRADDADSKRAYQPSLPRPLNAQRGALALQSHPSVRVALAKLVVVIST